MRDINACNASIALTALSEIPEKSEQNIGGNEAKRMRDNNNDVDIAVMASQVNDIKVAVRDIQNTLKSDYVKKEQFEPIQKIVYGLVGKILIAVIGGIMALLIQR